MPTTSKIMEQRKAGYVTYGGSCADLLYPSGTLRACFGAWLCRVAFLYSGGPGLLTSAWLCWRCERRLETGYLIGGSSRARRLPVLRYTGPLGRKPALKERPPTCAGAFTFSFNTGVVSSCKSILIKDARFSLSNLNTSCPNEVIEICYLAPRLLLPRIRADRINDVYVMSLHLGSSL